MPMRTLTLVKLWEHVVTLTWLHDKFIISRKVPLKAKCELKTWFEPMK